MSQSFVYIGADHAGFALKEVLEKFLQEKGYSVFDCGNEAFFEKDDYPDFSVGVAQRVVRNPGSFGIVLCGSGAGVCIAANKVFGIRAALAWDECSARAARADDDSNVLCLGARFLSVEAAKKIVLMWLETAFEGEDRFVRRIEKITRYENHSWGSGGGEECVRGEVVGAILERDEARARTKLTSAQGFLQSTQIDVLDDSFVSGRTFSLQHFPLHLFPFSFEAHLMVRNPLSFVEMCSRLGFEGVSFHWEVMQGDVKKTFALCDEIAKRGMRTGVAICPETKVSDIVALASHIDRVLVLGVHPGKSGQEMLPKTYAKISEARKLFPCRVSVGVDGGVTQDNVAQCVKSGADRIVASSALFERGDLEKSMRNMQKTIRHVLSA